MKYFRTNSELNGTCYHEFQKGKWDGVTFWKNDSLYLYDDILYDLKIVELLLSVIPAYDEFGETEINELQWNEICNTAASIGSELKAVIDEADVWARETFKTYRIFTILGI